MSITFDQLNTWSTVLSRHGGDPAETARALGFSGDLTRRGDAWEVSAPPPGVKRASLVGTPAEVEYVELQLAEAVPRSVFDALGPGNLLPRTGPGRPYKVAYHVDLAGAPHTCEVIAAFELEPTAPDALAQSVVLRRDRR